MKILTKDELIHSKFGTIFCNYKRMEPDIKNIFVNISSEMVIQKGYFSSVCITPYDYTIPSSRIHVIDIDDIKNTLFVAFEEEDIKKLAIKLPENKHSMQIKVKELLYTLHSDLNTIIDDINYTEKGIDNKILESFVLSWEIVNNCLIINTSESKRMMLVKCICVNDEILNNNEIRFGNVYWMDSYNKIKDLSGNFMLHIYWDKYMEKDIGLFPEKYFKPVIEGD